MMNHPYRERNQFVFHLNLTKTAMYIVQVHCTQYSQVIYVVQTCGMQESEEQIDCMTPIKDLN